MRTIVAFLAAFSCSAIATEIPLQVLEKNGVEIRLMNSPCVDQTAISMIKPDYMPRFRALQSIWPERDGSRKAYPGCWAELTAEENGGNAGILVVFSDGTATVIAREEFRKLRGQVGI